MQDKQQRVTRGLAGYTTLIQSSLHKSEYCYCESVESTQRRLHETHISQDDHTHMVLCKDIRYESHLKISR